MTAEFLSAGSEIPEGGFKGFPLSAAAVSIVNLKLDFRLVAAVILFWLAVWLFFRTIRKAERESASAMLKTAQIADPAWKEDDLLRRMADLFFKFQEAWGHFDIYALKSCVTENFYRLLIMEMGSLKRRQRQNFALIPQIRSIRILWAVDETDNEKDIAVAEVNARMDDVLIDTENSNMLYANYDYFCQYWVFRRENDIWKVDAIRSDAERPFLAESAIKGFAQRNGFFYDPEFGQVVIPDRGALFSRTKFNKSSADNHVIGSLCGRTVQFYTYNPKLSKRSRLMAGSDEKKKMLKSLENPYGESQDASMPMLASSGSGYIVGQAILPLNFRDVLLRKKRFFDFAPRGLKRFSGQNDRFTIFADPQDDVSAFPLATDAFLQKLADLPCDVSVEIVGSFLYLYAKSNTGATYETLLDLLTLILEEIKQA